MGKKPMRACTGCGEVRTIQGRGLCPTCYYHARKDEGVPIKNPAEKLPAVESAAVKESSTVLNPEPSLAVGECLSLHFDGEADRALFVKLSDLARRERRTASAQVLTILEDYLAG